MSNTIKDRKARNLEVTLGSSLWKNERVAGTRTSWPQKAVSLGLEQMDRARMLLLI